MDITRGRHGIAVVVATAAMVFAHAAQAQEYRGTGTFSSGQEVPGPPVVASPGTGSITALLDATGLSLAVDLSYQNLLAPAVGAHIHTGGPATNGPVAIDFGTNGFLFGLTSGSYSNVFDLTSAASYGSAYLASFGGIVSAARADFVSNFVASDVYGNLHTSARPAGEIRANLAVAPIPEPETYALMLAGLAGIAAVARRRRARGAA